MLKLISVALRLFGTLEYCCICVFYAVLTVLSVLAHPILVTLWLKIMVAWKLEDGGETFLSIMA